MNIPTLGMMTIQTPPEHPHGAAGYSFLQQVRVAEWQTR